MPPVAQATDYVWRTTPADGNFNNVGNWEPVPGGNWGTLPRFTAFFDATTQPNISILANTTIGGWTFTVGASSYQFTVPTSTAMHFDGAGIDIQGGSVIINNNGQVEFSLISTAGSAIINNYGNLNFSFSSTAGTATINNYGSISFFTSGCCGGTSTAGNARLINNAGAIIDFSGSTGPLGNNKLTAGSIEGAGQYILGDNELTVGSNNLSTEVSGIIENGTFGGGGGTVRGSLTKVGTGILTLSGTNTYTGATTVDAGTLAVNGSIASSSGVTVNNGGTLSGTGQLPTTVINNGGTLAPGNSIDTITVNGNLTFNAGSTYAVEVSPTTADRTNVIGGTATLTGATVQAVALPGSFQSRTYTILNADGGFGGTQFAGLTVTGSFAPARNPHLTYDANNVFLVLDPGAIVLPQGASDNNANVASGINKAVDNGSTPPPQFDALLNMSGSQLTTALNQVSGQPTTGGATSGTQMMTSFLTLLLNPFGAAPGSNPGTLGFARGFGAGEQALSPEAAAAYAAVTPKDARLDMFDQRWRLWGQAYGGYNRTSGDASLGSSDTTARTWGFASGADYRVAPDTLVGFALAGGSMNWGLAQGLGGGKSDVFQVGVYGSRSLGPAYVSGALSYAWHGMSTERTVTVAGNDKLAASFNAHSFGGRIETGYRLVTPWLGVTPYAALQVQNFRTPSYGENAVSGSAAFALSYEARSTTSTRVELGAWFDKLIALDGGHGLALRARVAWAHDHSSNPALGAVFQTLPGSNFTVNGAQPAADSALLSAGAEIRLANHWAIGARFDGEFASRAQTYAGTGTIRYSW